MHLANLDEVILVGFFRQDCPKRDLRAILVGFQECPKRFLYLRYLTATAGEKSGINHNQRCGKPEGGKLNRVQPRKEADDLEGYFATCRSRSSSSVLQSMHNVAVGRASRRLRPISTPQLSQ